MEKHLATPTAPLIVAENFFPDAEEMRREYEAFFKTPYQHTDRHQVWDYWFVPEIYTYLRTSSDRVLGSDLVNAFMEALHEFARRLDLREVSYPFLSIYVNGCHQAVHNDALNGVYGYVYSLTRWDERNFTGGETLVGRLGVFDAVEPRQPRGRDNFFHVVPSRFNQLVLFDDRLPHMVPAIQGQMDPLSARVVLHGHIS